MNSTPNQIVARALLSLKAVKLSPQMPFTYASGLLGPIYCDNRILLSDVSKRDLVISSFIQIIKNSDLKFDVVAGVATAGIPYASIVADHLKLPLVYVRSKPKEHGTGNQIEGELPKESSVLLFEDLINQGGSSHSAVMAIKEHGSRVDLLLSVVDYQMRKAHDLFLKSSVVTHSLTNFKSIVLEAFAMGLINSSDEALLYDWQKDPVSWDKIARKI